MSRATHTSWLQVQRDSAGGAALDEFRAAHPEEQKRRSTGEQCEAFDLVEGTGGSSSGIEPENRHMLPT